MEVTMASGAPRYSNLLHDTQSVQITANGTPELPLLATARETSLDAACGFLIGAALVTPIWVALYLLLR